MHGGYLCDNKSNWIRSSSPLWNYDRTTQLVHKINTNTQITQNVYLSFAVYIETGARDNAGSLQFNLGAGVTSRTWKVSKIFTKYFYLF